MSAVSESMNRRMTLGHLASQYGFDLDPSFASAVTVTSLADDIDSIRPGALFVPGADVDVRQLVQAQQLGAYGAIVPLDDVPSPVALELAATALISLRAQFISMTAPVGALSPVAPSTMVSGLVSSVAASYTLSRWSSSLPAREIRRCEVVL